MRYLSYLKNIIFVIKYKIYNIVKTKSGIRREQKREQRPLPLIVTLTSYPKRFGSVFLTIESLLNQTFQPDKIILWLAEKEVQQNPLPLNLTKLKARGLEIRLVKENIKSYKKLIFTIEQFQHCLMVTCDDDMMYPKWFLQNLYRTYQQHPDCISAYRCRRMGKTSRQQLAAYNDWQFATNKRACYALFATCGGGALFPPDALNQQTTDRLFMQLCPSADDVWFKAMSLLNQTKTVMVKEHSFDFPRIMIKGSQKNTLWQINADKNDAQIENVFAHFNLHHYIAMDDEVSANPAKDAPKNTY